MSHYALAGNVNVPSKPARRLWRQALEQFRDLKPSEMAATIGSIISAVGIIGGFILWISGAFAGAQVAAHDLALIKAQITDLANQVTKLQDRLDGSPRADQLREMDRHLSAIDGRIDGIEARLRADEERLTRAATQIETIDAASKATLNRR